MAENSGFFRSVNGDRKYSVSFLAKWAGCFVSNGVYNGELAVIAGENMQVVVPAGRAWLGPNGERYKYENDSDKALPIANADGVLARKDTVVLRWDVNERSITAQVLAGEFSSNPVAPAISRTAEQYDLKLAEIYIAPGAMAITQAVIADTRLDSAVCGIVTSIVTQVDTSTFYNQIQSDLAQFKAKNQAEFTTWFQSIRDVLDESAAGNLLNMIQTHEADTVAHVTQEDHDEISGAVQSATLGGAAVTKSGTELQFPACVQGNTKAWVATVTTPDPDYPNTGWRLTIPNFVWSEGCMVTFTPTTTPDGNQWDNITINNDFSNLTFALRTLSHKAIESDSWAVNTTITVNLSSIKIPIDSTTNGNERNGTAFFKGGAGSVKEAYDFPLSMQTAAPTPVNTNHIWIHNVNRILAVDEAIRSDWNNYYCAMLDTTDNNYLHIESPKSLTDGTKSMVFDRHIPRDATPWHLGYSIIGKKYGGNFVVDAYSKWPRIYSKVNGVVDMEDAQRWDGSAWQWLSQKGHYLAFSPAAQNTFLYNRTDGLLSQHSSISSVLSYYDQACVFSPDGNYLFVGKAQKVLVFKRNGDMFDLNTTLTANLNHVFNIKISPDSNYVAICWDYFCSIYKKQSNGTWAFLTQFENPDTYFIYACSWDSTGSRLIFSWGIGSSSTRVRLYTRSADTFTYQANLSVPGSSVYGLDWKDNIIAVVANTSPNVYLLVLSSNTSATVITADAPTNQVSIGTNPVILSENRIFVMSGAGYTCRYTYTTSTLTNAGQSPNSHNGARALEVTPDEKYAFSLSSYYLDIYSISGNTMTLIQSIDISNAGNYASQIAIL